MKDSDKPEFVDIAWKLKDMGYKLYGTSGTCAWLNKHMVPCNEVRRKAVELSIPCITAVDTAASLVDCLRSEHSLANIPLVDIATLYRGK